MSPAAKICSVPACPELMPCPTHPKVPWQGSARSKELPPDWERRRKRVLRRDPLCQLAIVCGGLSLSVVVHHAGDPLDHRIEVLQGACDACHKVTIAEQAAAGHTR